MNIISIIILAVIGVFAVIGILVGAIKGFTHVKSWAVELLITGVAVIGLSYLLSGKVNGMIAAIIAIGATVLLVCVLMLLFAIFRSSLNKRIEKRKQLSYYKQYDEMEDNTEQILSALGEEDKKRYKKLAKRKFKQSGGGWSVTDKIFGALTLAIKGAVIGGFIIAILLTIVDFTRLANEGGSLSGVLGSVYTSGLWQFFKNYIFDFIVVGVVMLCLKSGFSSGITSWLWSIVVLALVVGSGFLAFSLAFNNPDFIVAAEKLEGNLSGTLEGISGFLEMVGLTTLSVAKGIIGLIVFVLLIIAVILIAVFVPKLIDKARDSVIFRGIDGVLGAIVLTTAILAILLVVGIVANNMYEAQFMGVFNAYFEKSGIATYFYDKGPFNFELPIKQWFN